MSANPTPAERRAWPIDYYAKLIGISRSKAWSMAKAGTLKTRMLEGRRVVMRVDAEAFEKALPEPAVQS